MTAMSREEQSALGQIGECYLLLSEEGWKEAPTSIVGVMKNLITQHRENRDLLRRMGGEGINETSL
jgi:hypothetical protein